MQVLPPGRTGGPSRLFIMRPVATTLLMVAILLAGIIGYRFLPVSALPEVDYPTIQVVTLYPGASPDVVTSAITAPLERQFGQMSGLKQMSSQSSGGASVVTLQFQLTLPLDVAEQEVQAAINAATNLLPNDLPNPPVYSKVNPADPPIMTLAVTSSAIPMTQVEDMVETRVAQKISQVSGVGLVTLAGGQRPAVRVKLNAQAIAALGLTSETVRTAITSANVNSAKGSLDGPARAVTLSANDQMQSAEDYRRLIIAYQNGAPIRLGDVASVEQGAENSWLGAWANQQRAIVMNVQRQPGANIIDTADSIRQMLPQLTESLPKSVKVQVLSDRTTNIRASVRDTQFELMLAIALVVMIIYLFLRNVPATIIPGVAVPLSLVGTFAVMVFLDFSINNLTLMALTIATGFVVDDAIVVVENVERVMAEEGLPPKEATRKSMGQIQGALVGIAMVLSAVFIPMAFFGGSTGAIYRQFSITIVSAMALSVLVALILTPALCATMLKPIQKGSHGATTGFFGWFNRMFDKSTHHYTDSVGNILRSTGRYLVLYLIIVVGMAWLFVRLPSSFLPDEDQGVFLSMAQLPAGATQERTQKVLDEMTNYYLTKEKDNVESVFAVNGFGFAGRGQNTGIAFVSLKDWSQRPGEENKVEAITGRAMGYFSQIKDAMVFAFNLPAIVELGTATGFDFQLIDQGGLGHEKLTQARNQLFGMVAQHPDVLTGVRPNGLEDTPQFKVDIDQEKAQALGVSISDINTTLGAAWGGSYVNDFIDRGRVKKVYIMSEAKYRMLPEDIGKWYVRGSDGQMVPFSAFSTSRWEYGSPRLERYNGLPSMEILGQAAPGKSTGEAMSLMEELAGKLPSGIGYDWTGMSYQERLSGNQAPALYAISLIVVFLCLAALYESWSIPFSVMLVVPLGVVGALLAATLRGLTNDVYFQVGLLTTIGLSAKNAILIVEFAKDLMEKEGKGLIEATLEAVRMRLRPILMTSLAFILGVMPLVISSGAGSGAQNAVGTGVMGGMVTATILAIFFVPVFFVVVRRRFSKKTEDIEHSHQVEHH